MSAISGWTATGSGVDNVFLSTSHSCPVLALYLFDVEVKISKACSTFPHWIPGNGAVPNRSMRAVFVSTAVKHRLPSDGNMKVDDH